MRVITEHGVKLENFPNSIRETNWLSRVNSSRPISLLSVPCGLRLRPSERPQACPPISTQTQMLWEKLKTKDFTSMMAEQEKSVSQAVLRGATPPAAGRGVSVTGFGGRSPQYCK